MKIRAYPLLFIDCQNSVGKYFLDGEGNFALPRLWKDPQTPGPDRVDTESARRNAIKTIQVDIEPKRCTWMITV